MSCGFPCQPQTTALPVIDMQRYFTRTDSTFARLSARRTPAGSIERYGERLDSLVIPNILGLRQAFRKNGSPVFYTRKGSNRADGGDLPAWCWRALNSDQPFALNFDQGWEAGWEASGCG